MPKVTGSFEVKLTPQRADDRTDVEFLGRLAIDKQFHGPLEATSVGQMLAARGEKPESAGYVALERVTGTLDGRLGAFILQHSGRSSPAGQSLQVTVVADSGIAALKGLTGSMTIVVEAGKHSYIFDYALAT
jgi:Protein of unknown function (DUF3224)